MNGMGVPTPLKLLIFTIFLVFGFLIPFEIYSALSRWTITNDLVSFAELDYAAVSRFTDFYNVESRIVDICLANNGTNFELNNYPTDIAKQPSNRYNQGGEPIDLSFLNINQTEMISKDLGSIKASLDSLESINIVLQDKIEGISLKEEFLGYVNTRNMSMYKGGQYQNYSLKEATRQMITTIVSILSLPSDQITSMNPDVNNYIRNMKGVIITGLRRFSAWADILKDSSVIREMEIEVFTRNFVIAAFAFFTVLIYLIIYCYHKQREVFIDTFYGFNPDHIEVMIERLHKFMELLQFHQMGSDLVDISFDDEDEETNLLLAEKKSEGFMGQLRRRKKKGSLIPLVGPFRVVLLGCFLLMLGWIYYSVKVQSAVVMENIEVLDTVERIASSEALNYYAVGSIETRFYDFSFRLVRGLPLSVRTNVFVNLLSMFNERSLKVKSI